MPQTNRPIAKSRRIDPVTVWNNPRAYALCDGCKELTYRDQLQEQMEYRGSTSPVPTGLFHCTECYDTPNAQFAPPILKPDPVPVYKPRPDDTDGETLVVRTTPVTLERDTTIVVVNVPTAAIINLWALPDNFADTLISDQSGAALVNNITVVPAAGLINGAASYVINTDYGSAPCVYQDGAWWVNRGN